ncbi:ABC transporter permease [Jonesiaceae bacterium BS-20]|uniref:ABC transporter permease n=1 Tax=Jonesiaceae bacterium BS-20 TaxID=3120821 RepID=A0AAU7DTR2_9MICO
MVRFVLRRNWLRMLIWTVVLAAMIAIVVQSQRVTFPTHADREAYAAIANTPSVAALTGLPYAASPLGGILNIKIWMTNAVALAFAVIFLVTRNGRAEEEAGRTELLRGGVLGQHAYSLANWVVAAGFSAAVGLLTALVAIGQDLPVLGSLVMGASYMGVGWAFIGVAAVAGQLAQTSRGANTIASVVLAAAYLIRAAADLAAMGDNPSGLTWLSPLGWGQQMRSFGEDLWWPLGVFVGFMAVLVLVALTLERIRDLGQGLLPDRPGPRTAAPFTRTPVGLTLRLQRGPIIGWGVGVLVGALFFGSIASSMVDLLGDNDTAAQVFVGNSKDLLDALLGFFAMANVLLIAAFAIQSADTIRAEERDGLAEGLRFLVGSLAYWPAILLMIALVVFCAAWLPRVAGAVTWSIFGFLIVLSMFGDLFGLPKWVTDNTPFTAISRADELFQLLPLVVITVLALSLAALGLWRLNSRDMTGE